MSRLPDPPELPAAARPPWPPWYASVSLLATIVAITFAALPVGALVLLACVLVARRAGSSRTPMPA